MEKTKLLGVFISPLVLRDTIIPFCVPLEGNIKLHPSKCVNFNNSNTVIKALYFRYKVTSETRNVVDSELDLIVLIEKNGQVYEQSIVASLGRSFYLPPMQNLVLIDLNGDGLLDIVFRQTYSYSVLMTDYNFINDTKGYYKRMLDESPSFKF